MNFVSNTQFLKYAKLENTLLRKEETQDINGQESHKKCSSFVITEIQINTTMRLVTQMAKNTQYKYLQGYETTGTPTLLVGDKNAETTSGNYLLVLCKLYTSLLHEPVIPLLIIYLGQMKTFLHKDLLRIFTAVLLIIAKNWTLKYLSIEVWLNKLWHNN